MNMINMRRAVQGAALAASISIVVGCGGGEPPAPREIVDLSPTIDEEMPRRVLGARTLEAFGYPPTTTFRHNVTETPLYVADSFIELYNHVGPHHDPPNHVIKGGRSTDQFPLDRFFGRAVVIDLRDKPKDEPLTVADFKDRGLRPDDVVIAFVGYTPPATADEFPSYAYLSADAAEYLAGLPIKAFASDMPSLGSIKNYMALMAKGVKGSDAITPEHYAFLSRDIPNIEGLVNLERIVDEEHVVFVGFPLKIKDGTGGPMRAAALVY